jgi:hypothetical protein
VLLPRTVARLLLPLALLHPKALLAKRVWKALLLLAIPAWKALPLAIPAWKGSPEQRDQLIPPL